MGLNSVKITLPSSLIRTRKIIQLSIVVLAYLEREPVLFAKEATMTSKGVLGGRFFSSKFIWIGTFHKEAYDFIDFRQQQRWHSYYCCYGDSPLSVIFCSSRSLIILIQILKT